MEPNELLTAISKDPEFVDTLDRDGLLSAVDALTGYVTEKATAIKDGTSDDPKADLAAGKEARERLDRVNARLNALNEEQAKDVAEAEALTEGLTPPAPEVEETPEAEVEVEVETPAEEPEPVLVASKPSLGKIAARKPRDTDPPDPEPRSALVASMGVNVPGVKKFETGLDVAKAALFQHKKLGSSNADAVYPIASFEYDHGYEIAREEEADYSMIEKMKSDAELRARGRIEEVLTGKPSALVAAIPVPCGPSEAVYDFVSVSSRDGLLQIPTANARRGGLIYPVVIAQPDITGDWDAAIGVAWDDSNPKPFHLVECPETDECVVVPYPTRLRFRNWEQRYNPEYVSHVMQESLVYHAHKINAVQIAAIKTLATDTNIGGFGGGTIVSLANTLAFAAARMRETYKASQSAPLSVLAPFWVRDALAVDLMTRQSTLSFENAQARASASLAAFNLDVQWLYDTPESIVGGVAFPATADFTMFFPSSYVRLDGGGLTIAETRDSTLNGLNQFEFFMETSEIVCEVGIKGWDITDVPVCPSGVTGTGIETLCEGATS